ncbi:GNAT family N-acetyltransferase [uncultured Pseudokineococcus sp.]|uniref:GNAT family N-acetyltransferase n=1 Tax=uncultured Pseudokineococcus sp. TaxID=1642928 RepID=UPI002614163C|nr:GNAT family N-acetyltransferase [uncultured Pseudokineococcus sp.]
MTSPAPIDAVAPRPVAAALPTAAPDLEAGGGVRLRAYREDDVDAVLAMASEAEFARWTTVPVPYRREDAEAFVREVVPAGWASGEAMTWALEVDGEHAGNVALRTTGTDGVLSVGYGLDARYRGRGAVSAALRVLLPWAAERGAAAARWSAHVGNWPSRRAAWAAGFRVEGAVRRAELQRGELRDCWVGTWAAGDPTAPATPWLDVPRVDLGDVVLRSWRDEDAGRVVEACTDPLTRRWLPRLPERYELQDARDFVEGMRRDAAEGHAVAWCAAEARDDRCLASVTLFALGQGGRPAEIGYWAHPDARGRGVVTTGVRAAARHALLPAEVGGLGLPAVLVRAEPGNAASRAVALRAGFAPAGWDLAGGGEPDDPPTPLDRFVLRAQDLPDA